MINDTGIYCIAAPNAEGGMFRQTKPLLSKPAQRQRKYRCVRGKLELRRRVICVCPIGSVPCELGSVAGWAEG